MEESHTFNKLPEELRHELNKLDLSVQLGNDMSLATWHFNLEFMKGLVALQVQQLRHSKLRHSKRAFTIL